MGRPVVLLQNVRPELLESKLQGTGELGVVGRYTELVRENVWVGVHGRLPLQLHVGDRG